METKLYFKIRFCFTFSHKKNRLNYFLLLLHVNVYPMNKKIGKESYGFLSKIKNEFNDGVMPDLTEISLREFISVYPHQKFSKYKVSGSGKVKSQFPLPGVKITKDSEIKINLE